MQWNCSSPNAARYRTVRWLCVWVDECPSEEVVELPKLHRRGSDLTSRRLRDVPRVKRVSTRALAERTNSSSQGERRRRLVLVGPVTVEKVHGVRWNISDIFGMGHRSQRRSGGGGGGHCLNLSPRIEVCLLTCIPS
ncbi:hypothetical protein G5I_01351 [Acromyrmex echinatior]|uniref:Uncharacterized protein n=1 Tax=Acromyrmex echinatior TaxID=103372 RepID=F4W7D5_ACREC|nr:hypothetical protein G5I_01351 [Acromyrmex echinatior]